FRVLVIARDVTPNLARQIWNRGEDAAGQQVAFDLRKPELDLVQPGRVGGRKVQVHSRMRVQKRRDGRGFVRGQVVDNHMDLAALRLGGDDVAQEVDEGGAG